MLKKIISLIGATGLSGALTLLASVAPSWFMSPENYGYFSQFYVAISIFTLLLGLGLTVSFTYYVGQKRISSHRVLKILAHLDGIGLLAIFASGLSLWAFSFGATIQAVGYGLIAAALFVRGVNLPSIYLGRQKIYSYNLVLLLRPASIALAVGTWALFFDNLKTLYISIIIYAAISYVVSFLLSQRELTNTFNQEGSPISDTAFFKYGIIALISNLAYILGQRGFVYILGANTSPQQAGVFFMFLALMEVMLLVPSGIGLYFFSKASAGHIKWKDLINCIFLALGIFLLANIVFILARIFSKDHNILPENYLNLLQLMTISIPLQICMLLLKVFSQLACGYGLARLTMYGSIVGGVISITIGYFLVDTYQINGAIIALFLGNFVNIILVCSGLYINIRRDKFHLDARVR